MRLAGQAKLGYYPTPARQVQFINSWLRSNGGSIRLLDPCCGKGEALEIVCQKTGGEMFGIELSDARCEEARGRVKNVLNTAFEYAVLTHGTFSAILLNPPYDGESLTGGGQRLEESFLRYATPLLMQSGVMIYIIPHIRITEVVAKHLAGWYRDLRCWKFEGDDFNDFDQVIIMGIKSSYRPPTDRQVAEIQAWASLQQVTGWQDSLKKDDKPTPNLTPLGEIDAGNGEYLVLPAPERGDNNQAFRFKFQPVCQEDYARMALEAAAKLTASQAWMKLRPPLGKEPITPAISPRKGHIAMLVSGGLVGTTFLEHNGKKMLLKGTPQKRRISIQRSEIDEIVREADGDGDGKDDKKKHLQRIDVDEKFESIISILTEDGEYEVINDSERTTEILKTHIDSLVEIVEQRNVPLYRYDPTREEMADVSALSLGRAWPGQAPGFSEAQKHIIIACMRTALKHKCALPIVEMGGGKTGIGAAIVEMLHRYGQRCGKEGSISYPALVAAPGMVTSDSANWIEEVPQIIPGGFARTVRMTAKPVAKPAKIIDWLKKEASSQFRFLVLDEGAQAGLGALAIMGNILAALEKADVALTDDRKAGLLQSLKKAEKTPPAKRKNAQEPNLLDGRIGGMAWLGLMGSTERDDNNVAKLMNESSLAGFVSEYKAGRLPGKSFAVISYETAKLGPGRVPAYRMRPWTRLVYEPATDQYVPKACTIPSCPVCGKPIAESYTSDGQPDDKIVQESDMEEWVATRRRFCQAPAPRWVWDPDADWTDAEGIKHLGKKVIATKDKEGNEYICGAPLFEYSGLRRESGVSYLKKKANGFFKTSMLDELHKAKSKGTGVGHVQAVLAGVSKYKIGLTGTLFGGYSTSIFWLLYRLLPDVRKQFAFNDEMEWAEQMGLIRRTFYVNPNARVPEDGAYTGSRFFEDVDERPGISPNVAKFILPICVFASLNDMGLPLPSYDEHIVRIDMTPEMQAQYTELDGSQDKPPRGLYGWALDERERPDGTGKGAIGVWWATIFNRPNSMFRTDIVTFNRRLAGKGRFAIRGPETVTVANAVHTDRLLPKEEWLVNLVKAQRAGGRKCMVYVRQTGERDIQEHLAEILHKEGLRVEIMRPSVESNKRIEWVKKNVGKFDVLITNPRLVEVGLNLTMLPTAIFYEIDPSFYTLYQAMKRVFRPFAPKPVEVYFSVYNGTAEATILDVMGEKFLSNQLLTGQEIGGALVPDDAGSVLQVAIYRTMNGVKTKQTTGIFGTQNSGTTESPLGSPTAASPALHPALSVEDWMAIHGDQLKVKPKRGKKQVPEGQLALDLFSFLEQ